MVINRGDIKRKRKSNSCVNMLSDCPKRTKVHAQRKFAQGSNVSSPVVTPVKEIERQDRSKDALPEPIELLPTKRPNTEDFLTFLCFRGTPVLPPNLNFFNTVNMIDSRLQTDETKTVYPKNGPILTSPATKSQNDRPFIAFGVRKRADPVVVGKQMDRKRRHALALQALRRKYQEQKMAKIRAVAVSKLSEKVVSKNIVKTRSITKNEIAKKIVTRKTNIKVVTRKHKSEIKQPIKSRMCLRSFRGRCIHRELNVQSHRKRSKTSRKLALMPPIKKSEKKKISSSEFSSDDDEPLMKSVKIKELKRSSPVLKTSISILRKFEEDNIRLTRSHNKMHKIINVKSQRNQSLNHRRIITRLTSNIRATTTQMKSKKVMQSPNIIKNIRTLVNCIKKEENQKSPKLLRTTRQQILKNNVTNSNYTCTRSRSEKLVNRGIKNKKRIKNLKRQTIDKTKQNEKVSTKNLHNKFLANKEIIDKKKKLNITFKKLTKKNESTEISKKDNSKNLITSTVLVNRSIEGIKEIGKILPLSAHVEKCSSAITKKYKAELLPISDKRDGRNESQVNIELKIDKKKYNSRIENSRPSRKTKEAAAIYMELLGHKLVNDAKIDDDNVSIDSYPELPNVRKTEQRENELKAKARSKLPDNKVAEDKEKEELNIIQKKTITEDVTIRKDINCDKSKVPKINMNDNETIIQKKSIPLEQETSVQIEEQEKKDVAKLIADNSSFSINKNYTFDEKEKCSEMSHNINNLSIYVPPHDSFPKLVNPTLKTKECISYSDNESLDEPDNNETNYEDKETKKNMKTSQLEQGFSDSDEEPLSNFTKSKIEIKKLECRKNIFVKTIDKRDFKSDIKSEVKKAKQECTKNYLPFSSSDDEEKYFHGFVKSELKTLQQLRIDAPICPHSLQPDFSCTDVGRRFGKYKVNMSNEQIEKWLNDSAIAGMNLKKEDDDILKFEEKVFSSERHIEISTPKIISLNREVDEKNPKIINSQNIEDFISETNKPNIKSLKSTNERKAIFKKEKTKPIRNVNAFSVSNERSVYAFEADNEDSISTPFRRPCRRPSSTATSKSEDESKTDDLLKHQGNKNISGDIIEKLENIEVKNESSQQKFFTKTMANKHSTIQKTEEKSMFPPANIVQKGKTDKILQKHVFNSKYSERNSESDDIKYKIPNSPSASSSSSAKFYKRQSTKMRNRVVDMCLPINTTEFPNLESVPQIVEAPVFCPTKREFQDPLEYIEKIRTKAEKFGICRIVPPKSFKPECKVSDDMRFTAYNQYVHKMLHRWGPNYKELVAIRKYLETQNISLTHLPWIGGMEIDLPRLYQTVQSLGGLKEVIEKKKWSKVSDFMKIPKSAQDRVTKLDDIYCKYLLPYDTLSPVEREKLLDEVETEWAKRESKTLDKVQRINKMDCSNADGDSDSDNEPEECITKGRNIALNAFYRIARNTMSMWFKTAEPLPEEVEQEFWKHVTLKNNHICVHSGSIDSGNWGYGFAVSKNSPFARHAWNLKVLTNNSGSVLRSMGPVMGVTVPTIHVGMVFSACCWYRDPHSLPWIEYLHTGGHKIWYAIPDSPSKQFHTTMLKLVPNYCRNKSIWLPSDTVMIPPKLLVDNGVSLCRTVQEPGQFIVVFPKVFTSNISTGYAVSESVYFAPLYWLQSAQNIFDELRKNCEPSMFSIDRLLLSIASDTRSSIDVLKEIIPAIRDVCNRERNLREKLESLGLITREKLPPPEAPTVRKRRKLQQESGDYECEICRANLFISLVNEVQEDAVYCLEHVIEYIEQNKIDVKNCKLLFTYECEELDLLIDKIKNAIEIKQQKQKNNPTKVSLSFSK